MTMQRILLAWIGAAIGIGLDLLIHNVELWYNGYHFEPNALITNGVAWLIVMVLGGLAFSLVVAIVQRFRPQLSWPGFICINAALLLGPAVIKTIEVAASCETGFQVCYLATDNLPLILQQWVTSVSEGIFAGWALALMKAAIPAVCAYATMRKFARISVPG